MEVDTPVSHALREAKEFMAETPQMVLLRPRHGIMALPLGGSSALGNSTSTTSILGATNTNITPTSANTAQLQNSSSASGFLSLGPTNSNVCVGFHSEDAPKWHPKTSDQPFYLVEPNRKSGSLVQPLSPPQPLCAFNNPSMIKMVPAHQAQSGGTSPRPSPPSGSSSAFSAGGRSPNLHPANTPVRTISQIKLAQQNNHGGASHAPLSVGFSGNGGGVPSSQMSTPRRQPTCSITFVGAGGEPLKFPPISPRREVVS